MRRIGDFDGVGEECEIEGDYVCLVLKDARAQTDKYSSTPQITPHVSARSWVKIRVSLERMLRHSRGCLVFTRYSSDIESEPCVACFGPEQENHLFKAD